MSNIYFRLNFSEFHGTPNKTDSPVPYPRTDVGFEPADVLILICKTSLNGSCVYTESHGELSISGWDDDLLEDYSVTLGNISTDNTAVSLKIFEIEIFMDKTDFWKTQIFFFWNFIDRVMS